jgi:hypothetical protein
MSIRVIAATVVTAGAMVAATCGTAAAATNRAASPAVQLTSIQLTGVQLLSALVPRSDFPAGFKIPKDGIFDSGGRLENSPARFHLSTMSCKSFANNFGDIGFGETATAADVLTNSKSTQLFGQQVYQFKTSSAATAIFKGIRAISRRCLAFLLSGVGSGLSVHAFDAPRILGHPTFEVNESGTVFGARTAIGTVFTVAGTDLYFTLKLGITVAPPGSPSGRTTVTRLIKRVQAFR